MKIGRFQWENLTAAIGAFVTANPGKLVFVILLATILMLIPLKNIDTRTKMSDYLPECEYIEADNMLRNEFDAVFTVVSILQSESGNVLDKEGLSILMDIEQAILSSDQLTHFLIDYDDSVITVADAVEAVLFDMSEGLYDVDDATEDELEEAIEEVLDDDSMSSLVSSGSGPEREYGIILVRFKHNLIARDDESAELVLLKVMQEHVPEGYKLTSVAARNKQMEEDSKEGLRTFLPISLGVVCVILIIALRNVVDFVICMVSLTSVLIISFGAFALLDLQFSQITFFAPILIMVLAIDYAIHLILRYNEFRQKELEPHLAMSKAIRHMGVSILFSALTTVVAFGSNGLSSIPAIASFGYFLAIGLSVSFMVMMLFVPALKLLHFRMVHRSSAKKQETEYHKDSRPVSRPGTDKSRASRFGSVLAFHGTARKTVSLSIVVIALATGVAGVVVGRYLKRDLIAEDVYAADSLVLLNQRILNAEFPSIGIDRARIIIEADMCAPEVLRAVKESIANMADDKHVAKLEEEAKVSSIIPYLQETVRLRRTVSDIADADNDGLPDTRAEMSKILRRMYDKGVNGVVSAGEVKSLLSRGQGERPFDVALLIVETRDTHGINVGSLLTELRDDLRPLAELGQVKISYAGFVFERYEIVTAMTEGMIKATLTSVLLCTGIVTLLFMSVKYGLITALPIMLIVGWLLGAMYLLGFTLNMVTATITAMGVGLGIDY